MYIVQCTLYNVPTMYLQCTYNVPTMYLQCTYNVPTMYLQCTYNVPTMYLQCTYNVPTMYLQCTYNVPTMYLQCTYNVPTMYLQCTRTFYVQLRYSYAEQLKEYLLQGGHVNRPDYDGRSPLHLAACEGATSQPFNFHIDAVNVVLLFLVCAVDAQSYDNL